MTSRHVVVRFNGHANPPRALTNNSKGYAYDRAGRWYYVFAESDGEACLAALTRNGFSLFPADAELLRFASLAEAKAYTDAVWDSLRRGNKLMMAKSGTGGGTAA